MKAVEVLMEHGVPEERIIFINLVSGLETGKCGLGAEIVPLQIASPEGLRTFCTKYPLLRVVRVSRRVPILWVTMTTGCRRSQVGSIKVSMTRHTSSQVSVTLVNEGSCNVYPMIRSLTPSQVLLLMTSSAPCVGERWQPFVL